MVIPNALGKSSAVTMALFPSTDIIPKILAVDDEPDIVLALTDFLSWEGYSVTVVETGQAAIDICGQYEFQVVILDLGLPDRDGIDVLAQMLNHDPGLPIIILTAYSSLERYTGQMAQSQAFAYLTKPFDRKKLKETIRRAIQTRAQADTQKIPA